MDYGASFTAANRSHYRPYNPKVTQQYLQYEPLGIISMPFVQVSHHARTVQNMSHQENAINNLTPLVIVDLILYGIFLSLEQF